MTIRPLTAEEYNEITTALQRYPVGTASTLAVRSEEVAFLILRELLDLKERLYPADLEEVPKP